MLGAEGGLLAKPELAHLRILEQRNDDVDSRAPPRLDLGAEILAAARPGHQAEPMRLEASDPVNRCRRRRPLAHAADPRDSLHVSRSSQRAES